MRIISANYWSVWDIFMREWIAVVANVEILFATFISKILNLSWDTASWSCFFSTSNETNCGLECHCAVATVRFHFPLLGSFCGFIGIWKVCRIVSGEQVGRVAHVWFGHWSTTHAGCDRETFHTVCATPSTPRFAPLAIRRASDIGRCAHHAAPSARVPHCFSVLFSHSARASFCVHICTRTFWDDPCHTLRLRTLEEAAL